MKLLCWLNLALPELAQAEVVALLGAKKPKRVDGILLLDSDNWAPCKRLAFTRACGELLFECAEKDMWTSIDGFPWKKMQGSYSITIHHSKIRPKEVADRIWHWMDSPKVDLKASENPVHLFFVKGRVFCCKLLWENKERFEDRRPHMRAYHTPVSCHPKLARAMVNLSGVPSGSKLFDPFCGTGGLLIEAGLMGLRVSGSDASADMIEKSHKNCEQAGVSCELSVLDATHLYAPEKYVVSDLPYGRSSGLKSKQELEELYLGFLERLQELLRVRAVIAVPNSVDIRKLLKKTSLKVTNSFEDYVHATLSRRILVLEP